MIIFINKIASQSSVTSADVFVCPKPTNSSLLRNRLEQDYVLCLLELPLWAAVCEQFDSHGEW